MYDVTLRDDPAQTIAFPAERVALPETAGRLRRAMDEVFRALERADARCVGAPYCESAEPDAEGDLVEVRCCVPADRAVPPDGPASGGERPAGPVAVTRHVGRYEDLPAPFAAVAAWAAGRGLEAAGPPREVYLEHDPGPLARHVVEVVFPVRPAR